MHKRWMLAAAVMAALSAMSAAYAKPNFTGDWKVNVDKSDFGPMPPPSSITTKITHDDPEMKVATTQSGAQGEMSFEAKYSTDGKETSNTFGPMESKSTAKWEGDNLVVNTKLDMNGTEVKIKSTWSLADEGKTLKQVSHVESPQGEFDMTYVYEKQGSEKKESEKK